MSPVLIEDEVARISDAESEREWRPKANISFYGERRKKFSDGESLPITIAKLAGWIIAIYFIMQMVGQLPAPYPQGDLPEKDPFAFVQMERSYNTSQVVSGTVAIFDHGSITSR